MIVTSYLSCLEYAALPGSVGACLSAVLVNSALTVPSLPTILFLLWVSSSVLVGEFCL